MANVLEYSKIFQTELDKKIIPATTTGWMELNANQVKYTGGNEVKIPSIFMDGLADYDRANGFVRGAVELSYQTHTMTQDRGREFLLDSMDVDETNFVATAGNVLGEFQRTQVAPEIDAYRYSKLASIAIDKNRTGDVTLTGENIIDQLLTDLVNLEDVIGSQNFIITMSPLTKRLLSKAAKDLNYMGTGQLRKGELNIDVDTFNENGIVTASSKHLKSEFVFQDGVTSGQEKGGFADSATAKDINYIITTRDTPIAISKQDKVRIFTPETYQQADAWKVDYRRYHDLWVPDSKLAKLFVSLKPTV